MALLRTAQEALNNIRKHSGAASAKVRAELLSDGVARGGGAGDCRAIGQHVQLTVSDDGNGFDPSVEADGFGLKSMAKRLQEINGQLHIATSSSGGTSLAAVVPVNSPAPTGGTGLPRD